ncbi:MAG TPA: SIS domain-containing protein, partial [Firmicutes bacterium]|nr:SIS domain-containing protein [Bacillota bacterium]
MNWMKEDFEDLDNPATFAVDPSGMYGWIERMCDHLDDGAKKYLGKIIPKKYFGDGINNVVVCGMGGSAISGDFAFSAVREIIPVPFKVVRGYIEPRLLNPETLQIVISYSGNTEETIWCYEQGLSRGAKIVAIASGGELKNLAKRDGTPFVELPDDFLAPRLALGMMIPAILGVLESAFDNINGLDELIRDAVDSLKLGLNGFARDLPYDNNFPKKLAHDIHGVFPVVIASDLTLPVATRFQAQLNENSKWPC